MEAEKRTVNLNPCDFHDKLPARLDTSDLSGYGIMDVFKKQFLFS